MKNYKRNKNIQVSRLQSADVTKKMRLKRDIPHNVGENFAAQFWNSEIPLNLNISMDPVFMMLIFKSNDYLHIVIGCHLF